ncbi:MAG: hypothetical protein VKO21_10290 [Candidatus Sericytochromatia bacterium]|nr:hypothetical protein [Candidatus Sericytochromatia bacterium]
MPFEPPQLPAAPIVRVRRIVARALAGEAAEAAQLAREQEDPEDRYLDLVLAATACVRGGHAQAATELWLEAIAQYRPLVEEGLSGIHLRFVAEGVQLLGPEGRWAMLQALEPEIDALGALTAAHEPPGAFVRTLNDLIFGLYGREEGLAAIRQHGASHLLLVDLAARLPDDPSLGEALLGLLADAGEEARGWLGRNARGGSPFTRERLKRSLLRQMVALTELERRGHDILPFAADRLPWDGMQDLPRPLRLEMLTTMATVLTRVPPATRGALGHLWLRAALPPDWRHEGLPRRYAGLMAQILGPFAAEAPALADELERTLAWFLDHPQVMDVDQAEETALALSSALTSMPPGRPGQGLVDVLSWARDGAPAAIPRILADLYVAQGRMPDTWEGDWPRTPLDAWSVVRETPESLRPGLAAHALARSAWRAEDELAGEDPARRQAVAALLACHPEALADPALARHVQGALTAAWPYGPGRRTLELLGPDVPHRITASLLEAAMGCEDDPVLAHDQGLRRILPWLAARDVAQALRAAAGFSNRNHTSWFVGSLLDRGWLDSADLADLEAAAPHPFLIGAWELERLGRDTPA